MPIPSLSQVSNIVPIAIFVFGDSWYPSTYNIPATDDKYTVIYRGSRIVSKSTK